LTAVTASVSVPVSKPPLLSETVYVAAGTGPLKLEAGTNVYEPSALIVSVPTFGIEAGEPATNVPATPSTVNCVIVSGLLSASVSPTSRPEAAGTVRVVSSVAVPVSSSATGASLTAVTFNVTVVVSVTPPDVTV